MQRKDTWSFRVPMRLLALRLRIERVHTKGSISVTRDMVPQVKGRLAMPEGSNGSARFNRHGFDGCCWEAFCIFAYGGLVGNSHLTAKI